MKPVTDPALLAQLEGTTAPSGLKPVTDPALLAQLNGPSANQPDNRTGFQKAVDSNPISRGFVGLGGGLVKAGVGVLQTGSQALGMDSLANAGGQVTQDVNQNLEKLGTAGKVGGFVGEVAPYAALPVGGASMVGRAALGAAGGALSGGLQAQENPNMAERGKDAAIGALVGAAVPVALTGAGKVAKGVAGDFSKGLQQGLPAAQPTTSQGIKAAAQQLYAKADELGANIKPESTNNFIDEIAKLAPQTEAGKAVAGENAVTKLMANLGALRDKPLTLQAAQEVDKALGDAADAAMDGFKVTNEARQIMQIQNRFRDMVNNADAGEGIGVWRDAQKMWRQAVQVGDIERIITRAELTDNPATSLRTQFRNIVANEGRLRQFDKPTQKEIRKAAETGIVTDILRIGSSRAIPIVSGAIGSTGGFVGTALGGAAGYAGAKAANMGATALQMGKARNVVNTIIKLETPSAAEKAGAALRKIIGERAAPVVQSMQAGASVDDVAKQLMAEAGTPTKALQAVKAMQTGADQTDKQALEALGKSLREQLKSTDVYNDISKSFDNLKWDKVDTKTKAVKTLQNIAKVYDGIDVSKLTAEDYKAIFPREHIIGRGTRTLLDWRQTVGDKALSGKSFDNAAKMEREAHDRLLTRLREFALHETQKQFDDPTWISWARNKAQKRGITDTEFSKQLEKAKLDATKGIDSGWVQIRPNDLLEFYKNRDEVKKFKNINAKSMRQQLAEKAQETAADTKITRSPLDGNSQRGAMSSNLTLPLTVGAGGLAAANFASSLAVPNTGPSQDAWANQPRDVQMANEQAKRMDEVQQWEQRKAEEAMQKGSSKPLQPDVQSGQPNDTAIEPAAGPTSQADPIETYLDRKMMVESGGKANAKAKTSSATGLFQYTTARWLEVAPKALGDAVKGLSKADILRLRLNPQASRVVARYDTKNELVPALERAGVPVTSTTLYLAHFLGETGAKKLLTARIGTPVEKILGADQIKANPSVLKGKKAEEVLRWAMAKMG